MQSNRHTITKVALVERLALASRFTWRAGNSTPRLPVKFSWLDKEEMEVY
jgi:hypothetical protein